MWQSKNNSITFTCNEVIFCPFLVLLLRYLVGKAVALQVNVLILRSYSYMRQMGNQQQDYCSVLLTRRHPLWHGAAACLWAASTFPRGLYSQMTCSMQPCTGTSKGNHGDHVHCVPTAGWTVIVITIHEQLKPGPASITHCCHSCWFSLTARLAYIECLLLRIVSVSSSTSFTANIAHWVSYTVAAESWIAEYKINVVKTYAKIACIHHVVYQTRVLLLFTLKVIFTGRYFLLLLK